VPGQFQERGAREQDCPTDPVVGQPGMGSGRQPPGQEYLTTIGEFYRRTQ
jgi:hypothetical protein